MQIDPTKQTKLENYKLLIGSVLPRPIAFVSSMGKEGVVNAAPFSFFTVVSTEPPMISVTAMRKPGNIQKDTARYIGETGEFVVHVVDTDNVAQVNETATDFPPHVSEVDTVGLTLHPSVRVKVPRIAESKIQMECRLHQMLPLGGTSEAPNADLIIGEVVMFHVQDELLSEGRIITETLNPVGRLAGTTYGKLGEMFSMPRLSYEEWQQKKTQEK